MEKRFNYVDAPSLFIQYDKEEISSKITSKLLSNQRTSSIRITGGCGDMDTEQGRELREFFGQSFEGYTGNIIVGGTRMIYIDEHTHTPQKFVKIGITEVASYIQSHYAPDSQTLGIVAKTDDYKLVPNVGVIIQDPKDSDYLTVLHDELNILLQIIPGVDKNYLDDDVPISKFEQFLYDNTKTKWEIEFYSAWKILSNLRTNANHNCCLVAYNGGETTRKEILYCTKQGWQVVLIQGSGRVTDEFCADKDFLSQHENVSVVQKNAPSLRSVLLKKKFINSPNKTVYVK